MASPAVALVATVATVANSPIPRRGEVADESVVSSEVSFVKFVAIERSGRTRSARARIAFETWASSGVLLSPSPAPSPSPPA